MRTGGRRTATVGECEKWETDKTQRKKTPKVELTMTHIVSIFGLELELGPFISSPDPSFCLMFVVQVYS